MNRENDILNRTRFLIQGLKDYTDARVDEAAEEAVRRVIKKSIKNCLKMAGLTALAILMFFGFIGLAFVSFYYELGCANLYNSLPMCSYINLGYRG